MSARAPGWTGCGRPASRRPGNLSDPTDLQMAAKASAEARPSFDRPVDPRLRGGAEPSAEPDPPMRRTTASQTVSHAAKRSDEVGERDEDADDPRRQERQPRRSRGVAPALVRREEHRGEPDPPRRGRRGARSSRRPRTYHSAPSDRTPGRTLDQLKAVVPAAAADRRARNGGTPTPPARTRSPTRRGRRASPPGPPVRPASQDEPATRTMMSGQSTSGDSAWVPIHPRPDGRLQGGGHRDFARLLVGRPMIDDDVAQRLQHPRVLFGHPRDDELLRRAPGAKVAVVGGPSAKRTERRDGEHIVLVFPRIVTREIVSGSSADCWSPRMGPT